MEEKKSEEYIGDLISAGFRSAIVLIGFPYSEGSRLSYKKRGEELGPDSLRRFLHKVCTPNNGEYGIDISKTGICDYGNIIPPSGFPTIKRSYDKLGTKCRICVNRGNIPFIVGGTREFLYSSVGALLPDGNGDIPNIPGNYPHSPQSPSCVLIINPTLDLDEYLYDQTGNKSIHSLNTLTALFNSPGFTAKKCHSLLFGLADSNISPQHIQYIHNNNAKIITISDIRASPQRIFEDAKTEGEVTIVTQGGNYFRTLMDDLAEKYSQIYIAFSLESIMVYNTIYIYIYIGWICTRGEHPS